MSQLPEHDHEHAKYSITMVSEMTGVPAQQLRRWENAGILTPARSAKGTRRYSDADLQRIRQIMALAATGINQAGIEQILQLQRELDVAETRAQTAEAKFPQHQSPQ